MLRYKIATKILTYCCVGLLTILLQPVSGANEFYESGERSPHGIGKFYMGRAISQVMGQLGARWLERSGRPLEERTDVLLDLLPLRPDMLVADIGAGTGYFSIPIAQRLTAGEVLAVDIQPEMLALIKQKSTSSDIHNIRLIQGRADTPLLPADEVDLVLMVDAYHEFEFPYEMGVGIKHGLKPGGVVILVEYRAEDPNVPILSLHKMSAEQAIKEWQALGFIFEGNIDDLPQQHVLVFRKPNPLN